MSKINFKKNTFSNSAGVHTVQSEEKRILLQPLVCMYIIQKFLIILHYFFYFWIIVLLLNMAMTEEERCVN